MSTQGLNVEGMRKLSKVYKTDAQKLRDVGRDVSKRLRQLEGAGWWGNDAKQFADRWRDLTRTCLEASSSTLDDYSKRLDRQVQERDRKSVV